MMWSYMPQVPRQKATTSGPKLTTLSETFMALIMIRGGLNNSRFFWGLDTFRKGVSGSDEIPIIE